MQSVITCEQAVVMENMDPTATAFVSATMVEHVTWRRDPVFVAMGTWDLPAASGVLRIAMVRTARDCAPVRTGHAATSALGSANVHLATRESFAKIVSEVYVCSGHV